MKTLTVALVANVGDFTAKMAAAGGSAEAAAKKIGQTLTTADAKTQEALKKVSQTSLVLGGAMVAGFGVAAKAAMGFEKEMSGVRAATRATAGDMDLLRESALKAGADTVFSASEAAQAQTELAKAGVATADILGGGLAGALSLASAGELEVARAAEVAATALNVFRLGGEDMGHVADVMAAAAGEAQGSVDDIAAAMNQSALVAKQLGLSLEDTAAVLGLFAKNGLTGSDAGTSFKTMLQRLTPQSDEAAAKMRELGIDMFDASGKFVGISAAAEELRTGLSGLSEEQRATAMATIFGADAVRAASIVYQGGARSVDEWRTKVNQAGYASEQAAIKLDNLAGDLEALRGSIDTALIQGGSMATGILRGMTQGATAAVNSFAEMPSALQAAGMGLLGFGGSALAVVGSIGLIVPKINEARLALDALGAGGAKANRLLGGLGKIGGMAVGIGAAAFAVYQLGDAIDRSGEKMEKRLKELSKLAGGDLVRGFDEATEAARKGGSVIDNVGQGLKESWKLATGGAGGLLLIADAYREVANAGRHQEEVFRDLTKTNVARARAVIEALDAEGRETANLKRILDETVSSQRALNKDQAESAEILDATAEATGGLAAAMEELSPAAQAVQDAIASFIDPLRAYLDLSQEVADAERSAADERARAATAGLQAEGKRLDDRQRQMSRGLDDERTATRRRQASERDALVRGATESAEAFDTRKSELERRQRAEDEALDDRRTSLARSVEDEKAKLAERTEAVREAAEKEKAVAEERAKSVGPSVAQTLDDWQAQVDALKAWEGNVLKIASRGHDGVADYLASLGPNAAPLVERFASATEEEFERLRTQLPYLTGQMTAAIRTKIEEAGPVLEQAALVAGQRTADAYAQGLAMGAVRVEEIMAQIARTIGGVTPDAGGAYRTYTPGAGFSGPRMMAEGGTVSRAYARAGVLTMPTILAGEGRGSESYIPHDPSYRSTAVPVLHDTARALGFRAVPMAKGGWAGPLPSSPVGGAGDPERLGAAIARHLAPMLASSGVQVTQNNDFRGGDVPTAADMAYANRALGWELLVATGAG